MKLLRKNGCPSKKLKLYLEIAKIIIIQKESNPLQATLL